MSPMYITVLDAFVKTATLQSITSALSTTQLTLIPLMFPVNNPRGPYGYVSSDMIMLEAERLLPSTPPPSLLHPQPPRSFTLNPLVPSPSTPSFLQPQPPRSFTVFSLLPSPSSPLLRSPSSPLLTSPTTSSFLHPLPSSFLDLTPLLTSFSNPS